MTSAVMFMQWDNYQGNLTTPPFFRQDPLSFNSRQERLHQLSVGDRLWLTSRCPDDQQYYFVAVLVISDHKRNPPQSRETALYGEYAVLADPERSQNLGSRFPAEGLLRAFEFEKGKPIKYGASIGQSLQTLRVLTASDEQVLDAALQRVLSAENAIAETPCGLWTKCDAVFAAYFLKNWQQRQQPLAFLLYDPPPMLCSGSPVFIHSDKTLRLLAAFREGQFVAGHKQTVEAAERITERERIWSDYRANTIDPPTRSAFDDFWEGQNGIRGLFLMDNIIELPTPPAFKEYGRALEWGYPTGVGYRYLTLSQSYLLLRSTQLPEQSNRGYLNSLIGRTP